MLAYTRTIKAKSATNFRNHPVVNPYLKTPKLPVEPVRNPYLKKHKRSPPFVILWSFLPPFVMMMRMMILVLHHLFDDGRMNLIRRMRMKCLSIFFMPWTQLPVRWWKVHLSQPLLKSPIQINLELPAKLLHHQKLLSWAILLGRGWTPGSILCETSFLFFVQFRFATYWIFFWQAFTHLHCVLLASFWAHLPQRKSKCDHIFFMIILCNRC